MPKAMAKYFPKDRAFSKIEAAFSVLLDENNEQRVSILGYAKLWGWNRKRVRAFLDSFGAQILYPVSTKTRQKQWGKVSFKEDSEGGQKSGQKRDRKPKNRGQINLIDSNNLPGKRDRKQENGGQKRDRRGDTSIRKKKKNREYSRDSVPFRLAEMLLNAIQKRRAKFKKPDLQKWSRDVDLMIANDQRDPEEVTKVLQWCQEDPFWRNNILSTAKLRKQFDVLALQMEGDRTGNGSAKPTYHGEWL